MILTASQDIIFRCLRDLYKASMYEGTVQDVEAIFDMELDNLPFNKYYIPIYKLATIVNEYASTVDDEKERRDFIDFILLHAPTSSYNMWLSNK